MQNLVYIKIEDKTKLFSNISPNIFHFTTKVGSHWRVTRGAAVSSEALVCTLYTEHVKRGTDCRIHYV